jgi:predicted DCC family thiol-disulfide oxidoreductase YuxK
VKLSEDDNLNNIDSVIIFDGDCAFCNSCVNLLLRLDKNKKLRFTSSKSNFVKSIERRYSVNPNKDNSIIFINKSFLYYRSDAIIKILRVIGFNKFTVGILKLIPKFIRDAGYNFVAKHRYIFTKNIVCKFPNDEDKLRFIN